MRTKEIKRIELDARLWQDFYGNSYHNCDIYINDKLVHTIVFNYGYGRHYETTALHWITKNMFSPQLNKKITCEGLYTICKDFIKCKFISKSQYVSRKKDL